MLENLAKEPDFPVLLPSLNNAQKQLREEAREMVKSGPDADLPPVAKSPLPSPPSHRGYYNSPKPGHKVQTFQ